MDPTTTRWIARAAGLVAALLVGPASAQPVVAPPPLATDNTDDIVQAVEQLDDAVERWRRSCPKPDAHGLCISLRPVAEAGVRCEIPRLGRVVVKARRPKAAKRARRALGAAITEAEAVGPPTDPVLRPRYDEALARARIARADRALERFLGLHMPDDLDFVVEEWKRDSGIPRWEKQYEAQRKRTQRSKKQLKDFLDQTRDLASTLRPAYEGVARARLELRPPTLLRLALLTQHLADQMRASVVPPSLREPTLRAVYCQALDDQTGSMETQAHELLRACTMMADEHARQGPAVTTCRVLVERYDPPEAPPASP